MEMRKKKGRDEGKEEEMERGWKGRRGIVIFTQLRVVSIHKNLENKVDTYQSIVHY